MTQIDLTNANSALIELIAQYIADKAAELAEKIVEERMEQIKEFPYKKQNELMSELDISQSYLLKLEKAGLKRVKLDEADRYIWYSRPQLIALMDKIAK